MDVSEELWAEAVCGYVAPFQQKPWTLGRPAVTVVLSMLLGFLQVSFRKLLDVFFDRVDPTTLNRQGNDRGTQYRSAIYTHDLQQQADAQQKIAEVNEQLQQVRC